MIYKYEEWFDVETGKIETIGCIIERSSYEKLKNFQMCMEFSGQSGTCVSHGMNVFWCVIYCGY